MLSLLDVRTDNSSGKQSRASLGVVLKSVCAGSDIAT